MWFHIHKSISYATAYEVSMETLLFYWDYDVINYLFLVHTFLHNNIIS